MYVALVVTLEPEHDCWPAGYLWSRAIQILLTSDLIVGAKVVGAGHSGGVVAMFVCFLPVFSVTI
jgi:hypothetical protein